MPIYEYRCRSCGKPSQVFFRSFSATTSPTCSHCKSGDLVRVPSRVAQVRSESGYRDFLGDPTSFEAVDYDDPRSVAEWAKKMGEASGVDLGNDYDAMVDQMAHGDDFGDDAAPGDDFGLDD